MTRINKFAALFTDDDEATTNAATTTAATPTPTPTKATPTPNHHQEEDSWTQVQKRTSTPSNPVVRRVPYGWVPPAKTAPVPAPPKDPMAGFPALMPGMTTRKTAPVTGAWAKKSEAVLQPPSPKPKIILEEQEDKPALRGYYAARLQLEDRYYSEEEEEEVQQVQNNYAAGEWYA